MASCVSCRVVSASDSNSNYYSLLSLSHKNASTEEIKRAYRSLALRYHPDVCNTKNPSSKEESTRIFVQLNAAYRTLSDPVLRREYDSGLGLGSHGKTSRPSTRRIWEEQLFELQRRSNLRMAKMEKSIKET